MKNVTAKISKSVGVMRRLHCQLSADVMVKLQYAILWCIPIWLMHYWLGEDRDVLLLLRLSVLTGEHANYSPIYNHMILTFHSIYDNFTLLKAFNTNTLNFHQYFKDKLLSSLQPSHMHNTRHRTNSNFNTLCSF